MSCEVGCYEQRIQACDDIKLIAGLDPNASYYVIIRRPNQSNAYQFLITTDSDGTLVIDSERFPAGYLIQGNYLCIELRQGDNYLNKVKMSFSDVQYDCALIYLMEIEMAYTDMAPINVIQ